MASSGASSRCSPSSRSRSSPAITLWIGPWLRDVGGIASHEARADIQLYTTASHDRGLRAERRASPARSAASASATSPRPTSSACCSPWSAPGSPSCRRSIRSLAWLLFGFLGAYPIQYMPLLARSFPPRVCRPGQHQLQPRGLHRDLRRPMGDRQSRRPVATHRDRATRPTATPGRSARSSSCRLRVWRGCFCRGRVRFVQERAGAAD